MYTILHKERLNAQTVLITVEAPHIAAKARPGQFIILRINDNGERIPLTIAGADTAKGGVTVIFQEVGRTTKALGMLHQGDALTDFVGPLGNASHLDGYKRAAVVGGGLGVAIAYPQAVYLHDTGCEVDLIVGFRNKDLIIMEDKLHAACTHCYIATDDGSNGNKGFVTNILEEQLKSGVAYDVIIAIGPVPMMRAVAELTRPYGVKTVVSMNSIMIDGTGMCGGCRLTVGGETKFACVDGPEFDAHLVDFNEAMRRTAMYRDMERQSEEHWCKLLGNQ